MSKPGPKPTRKRFDWLATRLAAETVLCRECGAAPGTTCHGPTGAKLSDKAAHLPRIEDTI
ncbi:hypothetical protein L5G28_07525 [Gordonia sp. HY285]|uniref:zinc finger domain-containing protein n=1 Tax=Gordonia liuliyuniae TaxID=2911517 RepID=UPI001F26DA31|nr:hypothetical protein [Gordonia liuliyuniae]MCF8610010.1 hypothetical protein [Gordonia liuliyuniae]